MKIFKLFIIATINYMTYSSHAADHFNLRLDNYPILNVFIEGPDGAGKTTILNFLSKNYSNIVLPKSSQIGLMPNNKEEIVNWFQEQDVFVTARLYLLSHEARFQNIMNYSNRGHYRLLNKIRGTAPTLILSDRGPLSAKAYAYSSIKLGYPNIPDNIISQFVEKHFNYIPKAEQSISIVLYPDLSKAKDLFQRLINVPNNGREIKLIEGQIKYYQDNKYNEIEENILKLDPFATLEDNCIILKKYVDQAIGIMLAKEISKISHCTIKREYLGEIIQKILSIKRFGNIAIIGGLVQKGYTDNDIDIVFENIEDKENLRTLHQNLHIFQVEGESSIKDKYKLIIKPKD